MSEPTHGNTGPEMAPFKLTLATKSGHIYHVYFDSVSFVRNKTIFVQKSDKEFLKQVIGENQLRAFESI
jgi:hypothetical protein